MLARQAGGPRRSLLTGASAASFRTSNLDNIIQESESQYGDSARADTIQLPQRRQPGRGDRSLCSRAGLHRPTA